MYIPHFDVVVAHKDGSFAYYWFMTAEEAYNIRKETDQKRDGSKCFMYIV